MKIPDPKNYEEQLEIGTQIEMEHTKDPAEAKKIAMDHLEEYADYYTRLVKMETETKKEGISGVRFGIRKSQLAFDFGKPVPPKAKKKTTIPKPSSKKKDLVAKKVFVTRDGKTFQQTVWVKPEDENKEAQEKRENKQSQDARGFLPAETYEEFKEVNRERILEEVKKIRSTALSIKDEKRKKSYLKKEKGNLETMLTNAYAATKTLSKKETLIPMEKVFDRLGGADSLREKLLTQAEAEQKARKKGGNIPVELGAAEKLVTKISEMTGKTKKEILTALGIRDAKSETKKKPRIPVKGKNIESADPTFDPSSDDYRYQDTGHIAGSRKELAAENIRKMKKEGKLIRQRDIDWKAVEENPRMASELIVKSNLFGDVPWESLKSKGLEPGAGFLIDRVYASIQAKPDDSPKTRQDYAYGIESIRQRMEACKTPEEVTATISEMQDEYYGVILTASEDESYKSLEEKANLLRVEKHKIQKEYDGLIRAAQNANYEAGAILRKQEKRKSRGWKEDPELDKQYDVLKKKADKAWKVANAFKDKNPDTAYFEGPMAENITAYSGLAKMIKESAIKRNLESNPTTRAWRTLGPRFLGVLNYRRYKGSTSFGEHVTKAKRGLIKDWTWAESTEATAKRETKESVTFQLKVAENFERVGGKKVSVKTSGDLKKMFNLRDIQYGNWVSKDPVSAQFHTERTAEAFSDLADIIGLPEDKISLNGRLAIAFGARGKGNAGFGGAALAHYEPIERVINMTKMGGGGVLAHEWFHALDNLLSATMGQESNKGTYQSEKSGTTDPEINAAFERLMTTMKSGSEAVYLPVPYTEKDYRMAEYNLRDPRAGSVGEKIKGSSSVEEAFKAIDETFTSSIARYEQKFQDTGSKSYASMARKEKKNATAWRQVAAAHFGGNSKGGMIEAPVTLGVSSYYKESVRMNSSSREYWSSSKEMAARAFQAYVEDTLANQGRKNDYLSSMADNSNYDDPFTGIMWKPFPEGSEREAINKEMKNLFDVLKAKNAIQKAIEFEGDLLKKSQEDLWDKAKAAVKKQYPEIDEEDDLFWALVTTIFQKMGGDKKDLNRENKYAEKLKRLVIRRGGK